MNIRRTTTIEETTTPCIGCHEFPLSTRHHMLEVCRYGENPSDILICPNCHWVLHICVSAFIKKSKRAYKLWDHLTRHLGTDNPRLVWAQQMMKATRDKEIYEQVGKHLEDLQ